MEGMRPRITYGSRKMTQHSLANQHPIQYRCGVIRHRLRF
jgi:hypothetical protein